MKPAVKESLDSCAAYYKERDQTPGQICISKKYGTSSSDRDFIAATQRVVNNIDDSNDLQEEEEDDSCNDSSSNNRSTLKRKRNTEEDETRDNELKVVRGKKKKSDDSNLASGVKNGATTTKSILAMFRCTEDDEDDVKESGSNNVEPANDILQLMRQRDLQDVEEEGFFSQSLLTSTKIEKPEVKDEQSDSKRLKVVATLPFSRDDQDDDDDDETFNF